MFPARMLLLVALASATLAASPPPTSPRLAAPNFIAVGIEEKKAAVFSDYFAQQLGQFGIRVTTAHEIAALLGIERQKAMLGCSESSESCAAELAGALGVDGVITGNVARLEPQGYVLTVKIVNAADASTMGNYSGRVANDGEALDWLAATARTFAEARGLVAKPKGVHLRAKAWIPGAVGLVAAATGAALFSATRAYADALAGGEGAAPVNLDASIRAAQTRQGVGVALIGVGAAALATAAVFFATGSEESPSVQAAIAPGGAYAAFSWRWP